MGCSAILFTFGYSFANGLPCATNNSFVNLCPLTCNRGATEVGGWGKGCPKPPVELSGEALALANNATSANWRLDLRGFFTQGPLDQKLLPTSCKDLDLATCLKFDSVFPTIANPCQATCSSKK
jgi:hypothetical protein